MRTTEKQLVAKAQAVHTLSTEIGALTPGQSTGLDMGSKTNGRAYRLYFTEGDSGAHHRHPACPDSEGYLGMTKAEAWEALNHIGNVLYLAKRLMEARAAAIAV